MFLHASLDPTIDVAVYANDDPVETVELGHDGIALSSASQLGPRLWVEVFEALADEMQIHGRGIKFERVVLAPSDCAVRSKMR